MTAPRRMSLWKISVGDAKDYGDLKPKWAVRLQGWGEELLALRARDIGALAVVLLAFPFALIGGAALRCALVVGVIQWKLRIRARLKGADR